MNFTELDITLFSWKTATKIKDEATRVKTLGTTLSSLSKEFRRNFGIFRQFLIERNTYL